MPAPDEEDLPDLELRGIGQIARDWMTPQMSTRDRADILARARLLISCADGELRELRIENERLRNLLADTVPRADHDQIVDAYRRRIRHLEKRRTA